MFEAALPPLGISGGSGRGCRTLRVVTQYAFSAKRAALQLRNVGRSVEISGGFLNCLVLVLLPCVPLLEECVKQMWGGQNPVKVSDGYS